METEPVKDSLGGVWDLRTGSRAGRSRYVERPSGRQEPGNRPRIAARSQGLTT